MTEAQPATNPQAWWLSVARGAEYAELVKRRPRGGVVRPAIKPEGAAWYMEIPQSFAGLAGPYYRRPGDAAPLSRFATGKWGLNTVRMAPGLEITKEPDGRIKVVATP